MRAFVIHISACFFLLQCQVFFFGQTIASIRTYGDIFFEDGRQIVDCSTGGYLVAGTTSNDPATNTNFYVLKLDENFNCVWNRTLGGQDVEQGLGVLEDSEGNILICGYSNSFTDSGYDLLVYKLSSDGEYIWHKTIGGADWDFGYKIVKHPVDGYLICGKTYSTGNGNSDAYLVHLSLLGEIMSEWSYGGSDEDSFEDILIDGADIYVAGNSIQNEEELFFIYKLDESGYIISSFYSETGLHLNAISKLYNDIYVVGYTIVEGNKRSYMHCLHSNDWSTYFANIGTDNGNFEFTDIISDSKLIVIGNTDAFGLGGYDMLVQQQSIEGVFEAGLTFGTVGFDQAYCALRNGSGNLIFLGSTSSELQSKELTLVYWEDILLSQNYSLQYSDNSCVSLDITNPESIEEPSVFFDRKLSYLQFRDFRNISSVELFSSIGQLILSNANLETMNLTLPNLPTGVYILKYQEGDKTRVMKFCY
jgi:hypothetical protein